MRRLRSVTQEKKKLKFGSSSARAKSKSFKLRHYGYEKMEKSLKKRSKNIIISMPKSARDLTSITPRFRVKKNFFNPHQKKKITKFNNFDLEKRLERKKGFDYKCLEIHKAKKLVEKRSELMKIFFEQNKEKKMKKKAQENKLTIKEYIEKKRKLKFMENNDEAHFTIEERPDFELIKKEVRLRDNWLDFSYNPKTTIQLMKKIRTMQKVDKFLNRIEFIEGAKISDRIKMKVI